MGARPERSTHRGLHSRTIRTAARLRRSNSGGRAGVREKMGLNASQDNHLYEDNYFGSFLFSLVYYLRRLDGGLIRPPHIFDPSGDTQCFF